MYATVEEAFSYGAEFQKRLQDTLANPEFRPPWVSAIGSLYTWPDEENLNYYYKEAQKGLSQDERELLDTTYLLRRAVLLKNPSPNESSIKRLVKVIDQGAYLVGKKIHSDIDTLKSFTSQGKPESK